MKKPKITQEEHEKNLKMFHEMAGKTIDLIFSMDRMHEDFDDDLVRKSSLGAPIVAVISDVYYKGMGVNENEIPKHSFLKDK